MRKNVRLYALGLTALAAACSGGEKASEAQNNQTEANAQTVAANTTAPTNDSSAYNMAKPVEASKEAAEKPASASGTPNKAPEKPAAVVTAATPAPVPAKVEIAPPASFARCVVCHDAHKGGEDKLGPNLYGVFGAKAGKHRPGFNYSEALKNSGLVWNEDNLDKWLTKPMEMVPGTYMSFPGLKNPQQRQELIDYLKSLK